MEENYLVHHGIKGQKWGVRRFQNADGSLTSAGRRRYSQEDYNRLNTAKSRYKEAKELHKNAVRPAAKFNSASLKKMRKEDLKNTKDSIKVSNRKPSKHEAKLTEQYMKKGMTKEQAQIAAYRKAKTQKALMVAGALTLTAGAAITLSNKNVRDRVMSVNSKITTKSFKTPNGRRFPVYDFKHRYPVKSETMHENLGKHDKYKGFTNKKYSDKGRIGMLLDSQFAPKNAAGKIDGGYNDYSGYMPARSQDRRLFKISNRQTIYDGVRIGQNYKAYSRNPQKIRGAVGSSSKTKKGSIIKVYDKRDKLADAVVKDANRLKNKVTNTASKTGKAVAKTAYKHPIATPIAGYMGLVGGVGYASKRRMDKARYNTTNYNVVKKYRKEHPNSEMTDREIMDAYYKRNSN